MYDTMQPQLGSILNVSARNHLPRKYPFKEPRIEWTLLYSMLAKILQKLQTEICLTVMGVIIDLKKEAIF
jgi:hypothetical protein